MLKRTALRSLTRQDVDAIRGRLVERNGLTKEERLLLEAPEVSRDSVAGAIWWATGTLWQDKPLIVVACCAMIAWNFVTSLYQIGLHFIS